MADNVDEIKSEEEKEKEKKKQIGVGTIIIIIVMIFIAVVIYKNFISDKEYSGYTQEMTSERDDNGSTQYISYGDERIIKYGRDGITAIDSKGKSIWSASYEMKNPKAVVSGDSVAVADIGNKNLMIFDGNGNASQVEILNTIIQVGVSSQGIAAVMLKDDNVNYIQICDKDTVYAEIKSRVKEDGYPITMAYSSDGKKLVTSYLHVTGDTTENLVTFYNFSEVGQNYDSDIVMASDFDETMVPQIKFVNDTTVVLFADDKIQIYEMKEIPSLIYESDEYTSEIKSVAYGSEYIGVVTENASDAKNTLHVYSLKGKETAAVPVDMEYENMIISGEDIVFYSGKEMEIITKNGNIKYHETQEDAITSVLPYKDKNKYFMIDEQNINLIKLTNGK